MTHWIRATLLATTLGASGLHADVVHLTDGSRVVGTIEQISAAEARLSGTFMGDLTIPRNKVASLETDGTVTVQLDDGQYLTGRLATADAGAVALDVDQLGTRPLALAAISGVYREDPQSLQRKRLEVKVSGDANVGISIASGNSDSENLHLDGRVITRTPRNRYTVSGEFNKEESENVLVKENWASLVKYDHFVSPKWFWFNSASFEGDEFSDLNLRSAIAAGIGYQFFETDARSLSFEFGPSYIDENFEVADDESFLGSRWAIDYQQRLWDGLSFYHYQEGLLGLEDTRELTIRSRTGLRMDVTSRIQARVQTAIDWDNSPPEGSKGTDYEHTLTIGYRF